MIRLLAGLALLLSVSAVSAAEWVKIGEDSRGRAIEAHPTRVIVKFKAGRTVARLAADSPEFKVRRSYSEIPSLAAVEIKDQAALKAAVARDADPAAALKKTIADLQATGAFEYVAPDLVYYPRATPTDSAFLNGTLWGLNNTGINGGVVGADINVVKAWDVTTGDTNMVVAVIDTGVNYLHQDLATQMWRNPGEIAGNSIDDDGNGFVDDIFGIDAGADTGDPMDTDGHGTHCAGTIGAAANNFQHVGVIWKVQIMALKFISPNGSVTSDAIQCINYAISKGAKVSNNSWGNYTYDQALFDAFAAARTRGHLAIVAAGNEAINSDITISYPDGYDLDNIIAVGALNRRNELAFFSNFGVQSVDLVAPGEDIFSTFIGGTDRYATESGCSMAAPHVAGAAALVWSFDTNANYATIRGKLLQSVTPVPSLAGKIATGGRLNVFDALGGAVDGVLEVSVTPPGGTFFGGGSQVTVQVRVTDAFQVTDATVVGRINGVNVSFQNNGVAPDATAGDSTYTATITMPNTPNTYVLGIDVTAPGKIGTHLDVPYTVLLRPENDHFEDAIRFPISGGILEADNRLATPEPGSTPGGAGYGPDLGEPNHAGISNVRSLWWAWSTPVATSVIVDTAGTSFDDDAVLGVYSGTRVNALTEVRSSKASANGPNGTRAPFVKFTAQPSITYWIAVAQSELGTNSPGNVIVRVQPNGDIDTTIPTVRVTNILSGSFIRSSTNIIELSGTANDPAPNASGVASVQIKANDDQLFRTVIGTTNWRSGPINLTNGVNTILITAFDRADNQSAIVQFTVTYFPQDVSNDLFGNSTTLVGASGVVTANNANASKENNEPNHALNEGGHSLWWNYRPPADGVLVLSTEGSTFDTLLALYTVDDEVTDRSVSDLQLVAFSDNLGDLPTSELSATVERGRLYYIAVDGFGNRSGNIRLEYNFAALSIFKVTNLSGPGGTVMPDGQTAYPAGSALTLRAIPDQYKQFKSFTVTVTNANGSVTTTVVTNNPYTFEVTGNTRTVAEFEAKQFADDFETGDFSKLAWQVPGNNWRVESVVTNTATGASSRVARSVEIGDGAIASLILEERLLAGLASFDIRVSTETNRDVVEFFVNGQKMEDWSGEVPWGTYRFEIPANNGPTRLEWRYTKDFSLADGADAVFIDNLDVAFAPPLPIQVSITANPPTLTVTGPPNTDFELYESQDLIEWDRTFEEARSNSSGVATFSLPALAGPQKFYIVRQL